MAKRKKAKSKTGAVGGALGRGVGATWRFVAKSLGKSVRFIARGARDLDPAHQRDGIAFLILILALIATAGTWFHSDNLVGRAVYSFIYGGFGRIGFITPLVLITIQRLMKLYSQLGFYNSHSSIHKWMMQ